MPSIITLRPATSDDQALLERWDHEPDVAASGGDDDGYDWAVELRRTVGWRDILISHVQPHDTPIGVVVLIEASLEETHYWGTIDRGHWAIDIWIGEAEYRGRGFGRKIMAAVLARCFHQHEAHTVLVDPLLSNVRAHRFYERCGFRPMERRTFGSDDCHVYAITRAQFENSGRRYPPPE